MADDAKTVELEAAPEKVVETKVLPSRDELKNKGWSTKELDSAEKRGMIVKPGEEGKQTEEKAKADADAKVKADKEAKDKADAAAAGKGTDEKGKGSDSSLPDFTITDPAKEKVFLETFGPGTPQRAMYFRMKNERGARQRAEAERDKMALELQMRKDADARVKAGMEEEPELDDDGNQIDPEDKPLTTKQLKKMMKEQQDKLVADQAELRERGGKVSEAMKNQEEYAKSILPDFDDTVKLATELVNNPDLIQDPVKKGKLNKMLKDLQVTAATADQHDIDGYTASVIAYEMGQMHPKYGQKPEPDGADKKKDPKANGSQMTPEQMKRIEENAQRRASSASLPGTNGGRRTIAVEEVTVKDLLGMSAEQRYAFKKKHEERYKILMRG